MPRLWLQEKHLDAARKLLGPESRETTEFVATLLDDISNLKAMLQAMSIGGWGVQGPGRAGHGGMPGCGAGRVVGW